MSEQINPDRLHTLGLPLSNGRKPEREEDDKYEPVDRHGRTEYDKWIESRTPPPKPITNTMDEIIKLIKESERFVTPDDWKEKDRKIKHDFTSEELLSLLEAVSKEQNMTDRIKANQAGCSKGVDNAIADAPLVTDTLNQLNEE